MKFFALCLLLGLGSVLPVSAADKNDVGDALLLRLELLGEAEEPAIDGVEIASVDLLADIYGELDYVSVWSDAGRVEKWLAIIDKARDDGFAAAVDGNHARVDIA